MRIVYRQLQEIPFEKWMQEIELERHTDENEGSLGHPLPKDTECFPVGNIHRSEFIFGPMIISNIMENYLRHLWKMKLDRKMKLFDIISTIGKERNFISLMIQLM